ncbi:PspC domain-containing protein [Lactiplantibacillus plantarum]|nr:PspC domain-containing protein [Lactiplantibacillus plantarum]
MALRKSRKDRILLGVCGGIAECFQTSSTLVRLVFFFGGESSFGFTCTCLINYQRTSIFERTVYYTE